MPWFERRNKMRFLKHDKGRPWVEHFLGSVFFIGIVSTFAWIVVGIFHLLTGWGDG